MSQNTKQPPFFRVSSGGIFGSVWREEQQAKGSIRTRFNSRIEKRYRNEQGEWRSTGWYQPTDLADLVIVSISILLVTRIKFTDLGGVFDALTRPSKAQNHGGSNTDAASLG